MRRLLGYMGPYKCPVAASIALLLTSSLLQVAGPLLTKFAIDRYLLPVAARPHSAFDSYLSADPWTGVAQLSAVYLFVLLAVLALDFAQAYLMQLTGQKAMFDLRRELMAHLQKLDIAFFDRNPVGRLVTRVTTDVDVLNELFTSGLVNLLADVLMLAFVVFAMWQLNPGMTGLLLAVLPLVVYATIIFRRTVAESYRRIRVAIARINSYLQEHVNGIAVLQLFNREAKSAGEFDGINRDHMLAFKDSIFAYGWFYPVVEFLAMLAMASLLVYGGYQVRHNAITIGILVAFFQYGMRFFRPIQDLSEKYNILQSAMAASERIFKLMDTPPAIEAPEAPKPFPATPAAIEFDSVWFAYKDEDWVLRGVSFRIEPGETIAV
ncbi:MAG: ABC transporter transmembrane domain-containing protein, partial [Acidobacteria bacterium]|nr:ABC transporter transmembrane domain-containing protein [Acidobacteriota bacterium]